MKNTLNLTYEEGLRVMDALKDAAMDNGWTAEELDECGVIDEYVRAVDVALAAMGINLNIDVTPSYEDKDEDEDFDEDDEEDDDDTATYVLTVKGEFVLRYIEAGYPFEEACRVANILFGEGE